MSTKKNKRPVRPEGAETATIKRVAEQPAKKDDTLLTSFKEEALVWMLTIICSIIAYLVVGNIIHAVYHPDTEALKEQAAKLLYDVGAVRPEPVESMLFRAGVVVILVSLLGFYKLFSGMKALKEQAGKQLFSVLSFVCIAVIAWIVYAGYAAQNPYVKGGPEMPQNSRDFVGKSNFDFFFDGLFLGNYLLLYTFILVPAIACLFFIGVKKYNWGSGKLMGRIVAAICGAIILAIVAMHTFNFPYTFENKYDFNAVYYSMTQVYSGLPLLVNGFTNTYGLYPEFLNPIFHIIGLNVLHFSLVMALLMGAAFAFNYYVLNRFTSNKFILLAGFTTVVFFPYLDFKMVTAFDCIFALFPIRYIIPSTLAFLSALYFQKSSKALYWVTFAIMGCFVLWNPEIGIVCYLCWIVVNIYRDFYSPDGKIAIAKLLMHVSVAAGMIITVVLLYKGIAYAIYGASPDISLLFSTITVFGKIGFNMLPMTLVHPWLLSAVTLIIGFTYAVSKWYKKQADAKACMVLLFSLLGLGYFVYFQGRSHNWPYAYSTSFTIMLLTLLADELWEKIKDQNLQPLHAFFVVCLFVLSFSFFELLFGIGRINELVSQEDDKSKGADEQARIESNMDFIQKNSKEKEKIHVLTAMQYQGLYFGGSKRQAAFNPGIVDMFFRTDLNRLTNTLADSAYSVFIEPALCNFGFIARPLAAIGATYEMKAVNQTMMLMSKRQSKMPGETFFNNRESAVFHKKYTDDATGVKARINDAQGTMPVSLNPSFAVEALFHSDPQVYQYATLTGNMNDSSGFIIANVINSPNYFFGVNGKGFGVPVPGKEWVYCVMNVYPDHAEVYLDGVMAGSSAIASPLRQSPEKLFVGNMGQMRYFMGAISEVSVINKPLDKAEIEATWARVKGAVSGK